MATKIKTNSSNHSNVAALLENCPVNLILMNISARWKMQVLFNISQGEDQFSKLKKILPTLTDQVLTQRLHELECDGLVLKQPYKEGQMLRVNYIPTLQAIELLDIVKILCLWGSKYDYMHLVEKQLLLPDLSTVLA